MHQFPQICHDDVEYLLLPQLFLKLAISFGAIPLLVVSCLPTFLFLEMALLIKAPRKNNKHIYRMLYGIIPTAQGSGCF